MWELYDALIAGIPEGETVEQVSCGMMWTAVKTSGGGLGMAMTTDVHTLPAGHRGFAGMPLREAAEHVKSWNFIEAGIGMAALNAWYNTPARMESLSARQGDTRFCTFGLPLRGKKVCMVGALRYPAELFAEAASLSTLERADVPGTYPDSAAEYLLPGCDLVIITGSAFVNKTMPRLLQLARGAQVIITGPSTPMAPALLDFGVRRLAGLVLTDEKGCLDLVSEGFNATPYRFGERFIVE